MFQSDQDSSHEIPVIHLTNFLKRDESFNDYELVGIIKNILQMNPKTFVDFGTKVCALETKERLVSFLFDGMKDSF